ncbi:MAG: hypothetical protein ACE5HX_05290 [bacterium]
MKIIKKTPLIFVFTFISVSFLRAGLLLSQIERFVPREGEAIEVWRITNDPTVRDWANYHNTQCWSQDGRYICYTHFASNGKEFGIEEAAEICLFDLHENKDILVDKGTNPRWANNHNWLFYTRIRPEDGPLHGKGTQVMWMDVDAGTVKRIAYGVQRLRETDFEDRWLYGLQRLAHGERRAVRIPIKEDSRPEILPGEGKYQYSDKLTVNPKHPVIAFRDHRYPDYNYATNGTRDIPFIARYHSKCALDGNNKTAPFPIMEGAHFSWSGDGTYFLCGNGLMRGIRWDEFLPGNIHFLAPIRVGDICKSGRSGRWICGSTKSGRGPLAMADLRSGDGWIVMKTHSVICYPGSEDNSGPYDIDAKGSPDGTKIAFVSNYDLKNGPYAEITANVAGDKIVVNSTDGFPDKGRLVAVTGFHREVLKYERKTSTSFEKLTRGLYGTPVSSPEKGQTVTLFEARLLPEEQWKDLPLPTRKIRNIIKDMDSPLMRQRSSDIYVAVVRLPDTPYLRKIDDYVELIPGENHWETYGYHIFVDGNKITSAPLRPGASFTLIESGKYTAVAVEWSGLESQKSLPVEIAKSMKLKVLIEKPGDFSWTSDRWLLNGKETTTNEAVQSGEAVKEIVHLYDGVIHREWYQWGQITRRFDLNLAGKPTRQLFYQNGKLARRELHHRDGRHVSTEYFDSDGFITESIHCRIGRGKAYDYTHWWYEKGVPVRALKGGEIYEKKRNRWIRITNNKS